MKKIAVALLFSILVVPFFNSCKQCNKPKEVVVEKKDTLTMPKLDEASEAIKKDSLNPYLYYKRAQLFEHDGDLKHATEDMFKALTLDSLRPEFFIFTADLFEKNAEPKRGLALMEKAIATDSMNIAFYTKAAELAYIDTTIKNHLKLALAYLNTATKKDPQNAKIYFYKGNVFKELKDTTKALSAFQTATEMDPKFYDAYMQLGLLLEQRNDKNAEKYFDNAIKVSDKPTDALYSKADMLKQEAVRLQNANQDAKAVAKFSEAINDFKKVVELDYRNAEAYMGIGYSYYQMDSLQDAYKYYQLAAKIEPTYAGAYFSQGLVAEEMGRKKEAMGLYQNCLDLDPHFKRAEEHLKKLQALPQ